MNYKWGRKKEMGGKAKIPLTQDFRLRREWDSNPRYPFGVNTLSKRAPSATRTSLL